MALSLAFIMGIVGAMVAFLIGILIFSSVTDAIDCDDSYMSEQIQIQCNNAKNTAWLVVGILPIAMFFMLFRIFGGLDYDDDEETVMTQFAKSRETKKERQKRKQAEVDTQLQQYDDKEVHSFLTNWFRRKK